MHHKTEGKKETITFSHMTIHKIQRQFYITVTVVHQKKQTVHTRSWTKYQVLKTEWIRLNSSDMVLVQ